MRIGNRARDYNGSIKRVDEKDGGNVASLSNRRTGLKRAPQHRKTNNIKRAELGCDDRHRLTDAVYTNDWGHQAIYGYTYDDGDNMTQKVEPFNDDFNDNNRTGWTAYTGTWNVTGGYLINSVSGSGYSDLYKAKTTLDGEIRFSYYSEDTSNAGYFFRMLLRNATTERTDVRFYPGKAEIWDMHNSTWTMKDQDTSVTTTQGIWYDVVCKLDGANVTVWRAERGQQLQEVLSTTSSAATSNSFLWLQVPPWRTIPRG